jgi:UPF0716 family protein affecting phage T7 exclusion
MAKAEFRGAVLSTTQPPLRGRQRRKDVRAGYVSAVVIDALACALAAVALSLPALITTMIGLEFEA